jgi:hypothetical protein
MAKEKFFVEMFNANGAAGVFYEGKSDERAKEVLEHTIHIVRSCGGSCVIRYKHADANGAYQFLNGEEQAREVVQKAKSAAAGRK